MAKGQKRGNREPKKPKKVKKPAPVPASPTRAPSKGSSFIPGK